MLGEPTIDQVHIDAALTTYAVQKFYFSDIVSDLIAPAIRVPNVSGKFFVTDPRPGTSQDIEREIMPGDVAPEFNFVVDTDSYSCVTVALRHILPDVTARNADAVLAEKLKGIDQIINNLAIKREKKVHGLITEADTYPGGAAGAHWFAAAAAWDVPGTDPKVDIDQAVRQIKLATGMQANTMVCAPKSYDILTRNDEIKDLIRYNPAKVNQYFLTGDIGDQLFRLRLINAAGVYNQNAPLETIDMGFIWESTSDAGDDWVWIGYVDPRPSVWTAGFMNQFVFDMNNSAPGLMGRVRVYRDEPREGTWYEFRTEVEPKVTNDGGGVIITGLETQS